MSALKKNYSAHTTSLSPSSQEQQQQHTSTTESQDPRAVPAVNGNAKRSSLSDASVLRIQLPDDSRTITRHRCIVFNEKVRVKRIHCQAQLLDEEEIGELWFQQEDYENIKRKTMALIKAIQENNTGGVNYCTRGLERYFSIQEVQEKRNDAWDTVLDEQDLQRQERSFDPGRLSRAYSRCTRQSYHEAVERGRMDQDSIAKSTRRMRQMLREQHQEC